MKVMHVAESIQGGVATILSSMCNRQSGEHSISKVVVVVPASQVASLEFVLSPKINIVTFRGQSRVGRIFHMFFLLPKIFFCYRPDLIHLHSSFAGLVFRVLPIPFLKSKVIYQPHGVSFDKERMSSSVKRFFLIFAERALSLRTHKVVAISTYEFNQLASAGIADVLLVGNGVRDSNFKADFKYKRRDYFLFVGRFDRQKGLDLLVGLWGRISAGGPLYLVGAPVVSEFNSDICFFDSVVSLGWKLPTEIDEIIFHAKALIVPSRWEGFGLVVAEAYRNGTPVIASNRGALPSLVGNGVTGYIFDIDNIGVSLPLSLSSLDSIDAEELSMNCRKFYDDNFSEDQMNQSILAMYSQVCGGS